MYKTLIEEMKKAGFTGSRLAKAIGISISTFSYKLNGLRDFRLWEAVKIKEVIGSDLPIENLFEVAEDDHQCNG